jgi:hypothetical protein
LSLIYVVNYMIPNICVMFYYFLSYSINHVANRYRKERKLNKNYNYLLLTERRRANVERIWYSGEISNIIHETVVSYVSSKLLFFFTVYILISLSIQDSWWRCFNDKICLILTFLCCFVCINFCLRLCKFILCM